MASTGPVLLHVNGERLLHADTVSYMEPIEHEVRVWLPSGVSPVVITSWQVGFRECRQVVRLRVGGLPVRVVIPSPGADERASAEAERILSAVGTSTRGTVNGEVELTGPDGASLRVGREVVTLVGGGPRSGWTPRPKAPSGSASMLASGEVVLRVSVDGSPVFREFPVAVLPSLYRAEPVGTPEQWRSELLDHVRSTTPSVATALATAVRYQLPPASSVSELARISSAGEDHFVHDLLSRPYHSDVVVYKTSDVMLSIVEDYRPGLPGLQEHVWGATLGPETQVYVTHAANSSARPNGSCPGPGSSATSCWSCTGSRRTTRRSPGNPGNRRDLRHSRHRRRPVPGGQPRRVFR